MTFFDGNISVILRKFLIFWQQNFQKFRFPLFLFFFRKNTYILCNLHKIYGKFLFTKISYNYVNKMLFKEKKN